MDTPLYHHSLKLNATTADLRPPSRDISSAEPVDTKSTKICKSIRRAHSPPNHPQKDTRDAKGKRRPPNGDDNSQDNDIIREPENGKAILDGGRNSDEHEEELRALQSYAAFQVSLLRCLADDGDSIFNQQHQREIPFPDTLSQSGPLSEPPMLDSVCSAHPGLTLRVMKRTNSDGRCHEREQTYRAT